MYVPYGWPIAIWTGIQDDEEVLVVHSGEDVLLLVTTVRIQAWTAGSQRVKLGETLVSDDEGTVVAAHWDAPRERLVVLVRGGARNDLCDQWELRAWSHVMRSPPVPGNSISILSSIHKYSVDVPCFEGRVQAPVPARRDLARQPRSNRMPGLP